ncbi:MAG: YdcF family protein [Candidatus Vogelbacteria bacterium]|nr:YdcF family protein [Candidatus Vogelbacteria bacterium]
MKVGLIFGYGQNADGSLLDQTRDRCDVGVALYRGGKIGKIFLTVAVEQAGVKMADAMYHCLVRQGVTPRDILINRRGLNTAGEMDVFLTALGPLLSGAKVQVTFISTWYHIPRIFWLALWRVSPRLISFGIAWRYAHPWADVCIEFAKMVNAILRPRSSARILKSPLQ